MSFPVYFHFGPLTVHPHLLFEAIAYSVGFRLYLALRKSRGDSLEDSHRWWIVAAATSGALVGALLLADLENLPQLLHNWDSLRSPFAGKTIVGALIGGFAAVECAKRSLGIRRRTGDLFALPLCIGIAIGRVGCFLTGLEDHTAGTFTALPWGVNFGDGIRRHPTQLYEILFLVFLAILIARVSRRSFVHGDLFRLFLVGYLSFRFLVDFLKPDPAVLFGLSAIQIACLLTLIFCSRDIPRLVHELMSRATVDAVAPEPPTPLSSRTSQDFVP